MGVFTSIFSKKEPLEIGNSTMFKPKNVDINNIGKHMKRGATSNENYQDDSDQKHAYEQIIEDQIAKASSSNFEYCPKNPNNKLEQTNHHEKMETVTEVGCKSSEIINDKKGITENYTSFSSLTNEINTLNKFCEVLLPKEQIMMDTKFKTIAINKKEKFMDTKKEVSRDYKSSSLPDLKDSKLYQESFNSKNNLTEIDTDIETMLKKSKKSKKMNMNKSCPQLNMLNDIPSATKISRKRKKTLKYVKPLINTSISSDSDTDIMVTKIKPKRSKRLREMRKMKMNKSCLPSIELNKDNILSAKTASIKSPKLLKDKKRNLSEISPTISETKFKKPKMNRSSTSLSADLSEDKPLDIIPSRIIQELLESAPVMTTLKLSSNLVNSQQPILTQHEPNIEVNESNITEDNESSTPVYIDLTVDSLPDKTASRISSFKNKKEIDIIPVTSVSTGSGSGTAKSSITVTNSSSNLLPNNATTKSIECNTTKQTDLVQSTSEYEQVILPTVVVYYDKITKKKTFLVPKIRPHENPLISSNLVDIRNVMYAAKVPGQNSPPMTDVVDDTPHKRDITNCTTIVQPNCPVKLISEPVPIALPLLPSVQSFDDSARIIAQEPNNDNLTNLHNEIMSLPTPLLSIKPTHGTTDPSIILSWTLSTNDLVDTIMDYEIVSCEPASRIPNNTKDVWRSIGRVKHIPGNMTCTVKGDFLIGKTLFFSVRAKTFQGEYGPFSFPVDFSYV